jgi:hypothetical protein
MIRVFGTEILSSPCDVNYRKTHLESKTVTTSFLLFASSLSLREV